ncbi:MAG: cytochrome c oxidase assembly protein [Actinobacteria bacterium]|nr:cytochrome c oxidase assembly protein [Actinomycetota bacterium]
MLNNLLAHTGQPAAPHDVWTAWHLHPVLLFALVGAVWLHRKGSVGSGRPADVWRARAFMSAVAVLAVALVSPLERMAAALASAHMVQHVLIVLVAAPLFAASAPGSRLLRGSPLLVRRAPSHLRRLWLGSSRAALPTNPATVWLLHVATLWTWHSAAAYDAAVRSGAVHAIEHVTFLATAILLWRVMIGGRGGNVPGGLALLLIFGTAMASVLLSVLLTFATEPWYDAYTTTTGVWGLDPLADQQLAGVLMWVPAGMIYMGIGLSLFVSWIHRSERATG